MQRPKRILIVGGGFAGIYAYLELRKLFRGRAASVSVTLMSERNYFLFTPLIHEVATGSVSVPNIAQPVRQVFKPDFGEFMLDRVGKIDLAARKVISESAEMPYDYLLLATGSRTALRGFSENEVFTLKDLEEARRLKNHIISLFEEASREKDASRRRTLLTFVIAGGGPTGVELAAEISEFAASTLSKLYPSLSCSDIRIVLVHSGSELIPQFDPRLRKRSKIILESKKCVEMILGTKVLGIENDEAVLGGSVRIPTRTLILVSGIEARGPELSPSPARNKKEQIEVDEYLSIPSYPGAFAAGDVAAIKSGDTWVPQTAQAAVREGKAAARNIAALIEGRDMKPFRYGERGQLLSLGRWMAAAEISGFAFFGHFAWWIWRTIYASKLIGWANRLRVVLDWTIDVFYPRDTSKI